MCIWPSAVTGRGLPCLNRDEPSVSPIHSAAHFLHGSILVWALVKPALACLSCGWIIYSFLRLCSSNMKDRSGHYCRSELSIVFFFHLILQFINTLKKKKKKQGNFQPSCLRLLKIFPAIQCYYINMSNFLYSFIWNIEYTALQSVLSLNTAVMPVINSILSKLYVISENCAT